MSEGQGACASSAPEPLVRDRVVEASRQTGERIAAHPPDQARQAEGRFKDPPECGEQPVAVALRPQSASAYAASQAALPP